MIRNTDAELFGFLLAKACFFGSLPEILTQFAPVELVAKASLGIFRTLDQFACRSFRLVIFSGFERGHANPHQQTNARLTCGAGTFKRDQLLRRIAPHSSKIKPEGGAFWMELQRISKKRLSFLNVRHKDERRGTTY